MNSFEAPHIEYFTVSPILIVLGVAVVGVLVEAFAPRGSRYLVQVLLALVGLVAAIATSVVVFARTPMTLVDATRWLTARTTGLSRKSVCR